MEIPRAARNDRKYNMLKTLKDLDLNNKRVMIREDFNVPIENGKITNDRRIQAALPTIQYALQRNAKVILLSHLDRPEEGKYDPNLSLQLVAERLSKLLNKPVKFLKNWLDGIEINAGEIVLCENVRFNVGEKKNSPELAKKMAALCDIFVMDAFGTAHRAEASTTGVAEYAPIACAGPLLISELEALNKALKDPKKPLLAIVGGSKVSTKLQVLENLIHKVDQLIVGGGIANTFIAANGFNVGKSLYEPDLIPKAKELMQIAQQRGATIPIAKDVVVAKEFSKDAKAEIKLVNDIAADDMILDIGPNSIMELKMIIPAAKTIIWNGPVGVFEFEQFAKGTEAIAKTIANSDAFSLAGGGDTIAAIDKFNIADKISYISTGGGAFLEFIEGKKLPAIDVLQRCHPAT